MPELRFETISICHQSLLLPLRLVEPALQEVGVSSETEGATLEGNELFVQGSV